ncbi:MAG TPA: outer membrane beta-barrel protein [Methylocella sp.]
MSTPAISEFVERCFHGVRHRGKKFLAGLLICVTGYAAAYEPVRAADLPSAVSPVFEPPTPAAFSWTGFYAGVNVGGGIDHFAFPYAVNVPGPNGYTQGRDGITAGGPIGGIQAGYNYELPFWHLVAGVEIDLEAAGIVGQTRVNGALGSGLPVSATFGSKFEDFGTGRVRLGYAWGRLMPYVTAGFTFATTETFYDVVAPGFAATGSSTSTRSGIFPHVGVGGIGVEYAIAPNFTVKAEYLYEFINARPVVFNPAASAVILFNTRTMYHIGRVGLNYKFDWLSPPASAIVAKY